MEYKYMHNHSKCEHNLKFCKDCDVVYCDLCKEEWKKNNNTIWSTPMPLGGGIGGGNFYVGDIPNNITLCNCHA